MRQPTVREWLTSLGVLCAVSIPRREAEMRMAAFEPTIARQFPRAAFTQDSLDEVARMCAKGFPTYGELCNYLSAWWRENRPPVANAIAGPPRRTPGEEMELRDAELRREWDDARAIAAAYVECRDDPLLLRTLRSAVAKWAPQHLDLVPAPDAPVAEVPAAAEAEPLGLQRRQAHYLNRTQLRMAYQRAAATAADPSLVGASAMRLEALGGPVEKLSRETVEG